VRHDKTVKEVITLQRFFKYVEFKYIEKENARDNITKQRRNHRGTVSHESPEINKFEKSRFFPASVENCRDCVHCGKRKRRSNRVPR
jgi:hypothetical protein